METQLHPRFHQIESRIRLNHNFVSYLLLKLVSINLLFIRVGLFNRPIAPISLCTLLFLQLFDFSVEEEGLEFEGGASLAIDCAQGVNQ